MQVVNKQENNLIRTMVRGAYDLQKLRIQFGNRITGNFKAKLGQTPDGKTEAELEKEQKKILDQLRKSYIRITDGVVAEGSEAVDGKLPSSKKFIGDELISNYTELVLVDQYMSILKDEEQHFRRLGNVLNGIPIYDNFLKDVRGVGPAMAGIIISEIDITRSEYSSSLWKYAGLDVVTVGSYKDDAGKEHILPPEKIDAFFAENEEGTVMLAEGKYPVNIGGVGRSRREHCLENRPYINKAGEEAVRRSITYNPFLKTKLIGVLGTSFLRSGTATVDGKKVGGARRLALAIDNGFDPKEHSAEDLDFTVCNYLRQKGYDVIVEPSPYGRIYYDYRNRLENSPFHAEKTDAHRHNMAIRYAVKRFLVDLYLVWRKLEGLPVADEYSIGKLGMTHKKAA